MCKWGPELYFRVQLIVFFVYVFISSNMLHLYQNIKFPSDYQCKVLHVVCI